MSPSFSLLASSTTTIARPAAMSAISDQPANVADREREQLGGGLARGEHNVALVLPAGIVNHDDRPARGDVGDRLLHGVQAVGAVRRGLVCGLVCDHRSGLSAPSSRSTYLAIMSTSRLTVSPGRLRPMVVRASVSGIRLTSIQCAPGSGPVPSAEMVRLIPSMAIEPFSTT